MGEVTTEGIEIDVMGQPTENLSLFGGVAFIDAQIDSYDGGPCSFGQEFRNIGFRGQTTCGDNPARQDLGGGDLPFSPDWKLTLAAQYFVPLEARSFDLILKGNFLAQDDVQLSIDQDRYQKQDGYEILDLSASLQDKEGKWTGSIFVKNVFDKHWVHTVLSQSEFIIQNGYLQFLPRTFERRIGLELRYNWF